MNGTLISFIVLFSMQTLMSYAQTTNNTVIGTADNSTIIIKKNVTVTVRAEASYPKDLLTYEQIRSGGFLLYIFGKYISSRDKYSHILLLLRHLSRDPELYKSINRYHQSQGSGKYLKMAKII
jgi:hypothetical protein